MDATSPKPPKRKAAQMVRPDPQPSQPSGDAEADAQRSDSVLPTTQGPTSIPSPPDLPNSITPNSTAMTKIREWLLEVLVACPFSATDILDISIAVLCAFESDDKTAMKEDIGSWAIDNEIAMAKLVTEVFPGTDVQSLHDGSMDITGVRWKKLRKDEDDEKAFSSYALRLQPFPERVRKEAHKLLYVRDVKERAKLFLKQFFMCSEGITVTEESVWEMYSKGFGPSKDTHPILSVNALVEVLLQNFKGSSELEVSRDHFVVVDFTFTDDFKKAEYYLAKKRHHDFQRLASAGLISSPTQNPSKFAQKLRQDPLLSLPNGEDGPVTQRLRRRAAGGPLGDEEPGFPGVSLKRQQRKLKGNYETFKKEFVQTFGKPGSIVPTEEEWNAAAAEVLKRHK